MRKSIILSSILSIEAALIAASLLTGSGILAVPPGVKASISEQPIQIFVPDKNDSVDVLPTVDDHNINMEKYQNLVPKQWSETATGVKTELDTDDKVLAFTFDACGGKGGSGYDKELIDYLVKENVAATLFINSRWIDENYSAFMELAKNSLFEIENHGAQHKPLSVSGKSAYDIPGTKSVQEVTDEVKPSGDRIYELTGKRPKFFRAGTNYYDEIAVEIVNDLGEDAVGYSILGDAGATYSAAQIKKACLNAKPGSIIIFHMNHPEKETAEGVMQVVPALRAKGFRFVKLEDYPLK